MTRFRVHTSIGTFDVTAPDPKVAAEKVKADHPEAQVTKTKIIKEHRQ